MNVVPMNTPAAFNPIRQPFLLFVNSTIFYAELLAEQDGLSSGVKLDLR